MKKVGQIKKKLDEIMPLIEKEYNVKNLPPGVPALGARDSRACRAVLWFFFDVCGQYRH